MECLSCKTDKPLTLEFFHRQKGSATGFRLTCKECRKISSKKYYSEHAEEIIQKTDEWRKNNPEKAREIGLRSAIKYYWKEKESPETPEKAERKLRIKERRKKYNEEHKEEIAVKKSAYQKEHREQNNAARKRWEEKHPEEVKINKRHDAKRRKALKKGAPVNDLTQKQWEEIQAVFRFRCAYCGKKKTLTQDHITPLSKGGSHTSSNIVPACNQCNMKKHTGPILSPLQPLLITETPPKRKYQHTTKNEPATAPKPAPAPVPGPVPAPVTATVSAPVPVPGVAPHAPN